MRVNNLLGQAQERSDSEILRKGLVTNFRISGELVILLTEGKTVRKLLDLFCENGSIDGEGLVPSRLAGTRLKNDRKFTRLGLWGGG